VRDGGCRFPGCDDGPEGLHAHHTKRWEEGGPTDLDSGVLLSPHCHTVISQPGWSDRIETDGTYVVTTPSGRELRSAPPGLTPDRPLPVHTGAEAARPLPFDPTPDRVRDAAPATEAQPAPPPPPDKDRVDELLRHVVRCHDAGRRRHGRWRPSGWRRGATSIS
jgi:hypothetical protein